ncbi:MAG TPA: ABC transporter ATP-binding protein [Burkholderiales bacterium]|nr:ABC transporter ATP-binding protein [Burkholderiales bacterium]
MPPLLQLVHVSQAYGANRVINDLSLSLEQGRIGCLLGPSGSGKTTALRCIAGFERISAGEILLSGRVVSRPDYLMPPELRNIGMVFQDFALFPHLDVAKNIAFGLHQHETREREARVSELLEIVGLAGAEHKYPHELSGGQQQRVALARALAPKPELLLLDEPFSSLDAELRPRLSLEVRAILKGQDATAILVTHDQQEAFALADEIGIINEGALVQWDSAYNLYHRPRDRFVADFVGQGVFVSGTVLSDKQVEIELGILSGETAIPCTVGCRVDVLLRPDDIVHDDASPLQAEVVHKAFRGAEILYTLRLPSGAIALSLVPSHHNHALGEKIGIRLEADHIVAFDQVP